LPDVTFSNWIAGLAADTLSGPEKIPLVDVNGTTSKHATATLLAAFAVDQLQASGVPTITTLDDADMLNAFQSNVVKKLTAQNFFNWIVDKLEAITTGTTIVDGDKLVFNDGGVLKQIDIADVRTFLNSGAVSLGAQIAGLSAATLADSDQYVVAQTSTAFKTTFTAIAARVHAQFLAYTNSLPTVPSSGVSTLADADTFYVNDGGVASKVTAQTIASYVQAEVGAAIVSDAWDNYSALGAAASATDVFLLERSGTGRTATGANIASYVVATQDNAASAGSAVAGDSFLIFRSGTQNKMDIGALSTYVLATGWSAASGNPVASGDKLIIGRGGTTLGVTVDQLQTFVLTGVQASVLNLTGLPDATLVSSSLFLVGDVATPKKATLTQLETQLWSDFRAYVSGLDALTPLEDADVFYVIEGSTPKKVASSTIASYMETEMWDKSPVSPVLAGDTFWVRRSGASYTASATAIANYVAGVVTGSIDIGTLGNATLSDNDLFLVDEGASNTKVTLANLRAHFWQEFVTHVTGSTSLTTAVDADLLYIISGGASYKINVGDLWDNRYLADAKAIKLDDFAYPDDNTDLNATTSAHGLLVKASAPSAGLRNVVAIDNAETAYTNKALFDATLPAALGAAAAGSAMTAARRDHVHAMPKLDDLSAPDDNTDLNATSSAHGLLPKLSNNARQFFRGDGTYATYASITPTPVAAAGSNSGDAAALATTNTTFITCDLSTKGVRLPTGAAGDIMEVINNNATDAKLYPATGGVLNGLAADAAVVIPASKGVRCFCSAANTWTVFDMTAKAASA